MAKTKIRTKTTATYVNDFTVVDPETGGDVEMTLFKHSSGGMFAIDASFVEQTLDEEMPVINDPLNSKCHCTLIYPETNFESWVNTQDLPQD
jgi:hypothetical protein